MKIHEVGCHLRGHGPFVTTLAAIRQVELDRHLTRRSLARAISDHLPDQNLNATYWLSYPRAVLLIVYCSLLIRPATESVQTAAHQPSV